MDSSKKPQNRKQNIENGITDARRSLPHKLDLLFQALQEIKKARIILSNKKS